MTTLKQSYDKAQSRDVNLLYLNRILVNLQAYIEQVSHCILCICQYLCSKYL